MFCFVTSCYRETKGKFDCFCNQTKFFCDRHEKAIDQQQKACRIGWKCLCCKQGVVGNPHKFITVKSENDVCFNVCAPCAIQQLDSWIAAYFEMEKENLPEVSFAKTGRECEKCYATIQQSNGGGWTWCDRYINHSFCADCIQNACKDFM